MRKIHTDLMAPTTSSDIKSGKKRPKSRTKKKKTTKKKTNLSQEEKSSPSVCELVSVRECIRNFGSIENCNEKHRPISSTSDKNSQPIRSLRDIVQADLDELNKHFDEKWEKFCSSRRKELLSPKKYTPREIPIIEVHNVDRNNFVSPMSANLHHHMHSPHHHNHNLHQHQHHLCPLCTIEFNNLEIDTCNSRPSTTSSYNNSSKLQKSPKEFLETIIKRSKSCPSGLDRKIEENAYVEKDKISNESDFVHGNVDEQRKRRCQSAKKPNDKTAQQRKDDAFVDFIAARMVRSNLAANLRQQWSRKKLQEISDRKIKSFGRTIKFIPKCHRWNVDQTPGWKSFTVEE